MNVWAEEKWAEALQGKTEAYRKLGIYYLRRSGGRTIVQKRKRSVNRKLAYLCLKAAAGKGDVRAFYLLNHHFNRGKKVIDDESYRQIARDYMKIRDPEKKKYLQYYLKLGTKQQMKFISGQVPVCRRGKDAVPLEAKQKKGSDTLPVHQ
ncbi:MAG: hypothetical protein Q4E91_06595 [Lachnospiraceae bacterium]|nr:hypothetical protein [Lachnospiraceae bacterium]